MLFAYSGPKETIEERVDLLLNLPKEVAVDVETVDLEGPALVLAIAPNEQESFGFDFEEPLWRDMLKERTAVFHNAHYDLSKLGWQGSFEDTYLIYGALGEEQLSLKALAWDKACLSFITAKELMDKHNAKNMLGVPKNEMLSMCCKHAQATFALWKRVPEIPKVYYELDKKMIPVLLQMERAGLYIDQTEVQRQLDEHIPLRDKATADFQAIYGDINMNSYPQLSKALNLASTQEDIIQSLTFAGKDELLTYREHFKLINTYLLPFQKRIDENGRIHTRLDYTRTGRLRSFKNKGTDEGMALQNLPNGDLRKCIVPPSGFQFIDVDYSQLELRVLAHISNDPVMLDAFDRGLDLHQKTADDVLLDSTKRRQGKTLNFALVYGAEERKIAELVGCDFEEARNIKKRVFQTYPGFADWVKSTHISARRQQGVETIFGRRRKLYKLSSASRKDLSLSLLPWTL